VKTAPPFTIALVAAHDGKELMADAAVPLGNVLSRWGMADVLVCPWHAIHLADGTVQISGPTMRAGGRHAVYRRSCPAECTSFIPDCGSHAP